MLRRLELAASSIRRSDRRWASRLGLVAYVVAFAIPSFILLWSLFGGNLPPNIFRWFGVMLLVGVLILGVALLTVLKQGQGGSVVVEPSVLTLRGESSERLPIDQLESGIAMARPGGGGLVELVTQNGETIEIELATVETAHRLLSVLGIEDGTRVTILRVGTRYPASVVVTALTGITLAISVQFGGELMLLFGADAARLMILGGVAATGLVGGWLWSSSEVVIGRDGVQLRHVLDRFIPHEKIREVGLIPGDGRVQLSLRDGRRIAVHPIATGQPERMHALLGYLQRAMASDDGAAVAAIGTLDRSGIPIPAWRQRLAVLFDAEPGYRGARLAPDQAVAIAEDPLTSPERRLGAALALLGAGAIDDHAQKRLRIAAEGSANPKLRVALEAIAEGEIEDAAIEQALVTGKR